MQAYDGLLFPNFCFTPIDIISRFVTFNDNNNLSIGNPGDGSLRLSVRVKSLAYV